MRARLSRRGLGHKIARLGLGSRLFAAMALVVLAGAGTLLAIAVLVAPEVFVTHLRRAGLPGLSPTVIRHVDEAFTQAVLLALALGVLVAVVTAGLVTWLVSRRMAAPVAGLAEATALLADGRYDRVLPDPGLGPEFADLTAAVNQLAGRLRASEQVRRRLLADLAHELRTPIASLEATVEAVLDGVLPADATTLGTLAEQSSRLHRLVADLESVSRAEERQLALNPRPVRLTEIARRAVTALSPRYATEGVQLDLESRDDPLVAADPDRLVEAVMNLLDNALRHTPPGGTVTVSVDRQPGPDSIPSQARLSVADTGQGFEPGQAALLFERFYRADPARRPDPADRPDPASRPDPAGRSPGRHGSGIGLTITRAIVAAHAGRITAHSDGPGLGAVFTITLPPAGPSAARPARAPRP